MVQRRIIDALGKVAWQDSEIVGFEWNQNIDEIRRIDQYGETLQIAATDFNYHPIWGGMRRCTLADAGTVNHYGSNPRGDGLTLDGSDGRVMVQCPKYYIKSLEPEPNIYWNLFSPSAHPGFEVNPAWKQRGGTERDYIYGGAFGASLNLKTRDHSLNTMQLDSKYVEDSASDPCTQPFTGGTAATPTIFSVAFTSGSREFVVGEVLTNNALDAKVIDWHLSGGTFLGGDAAGTLYCQVYDDPWNGLDWSTPTSITDSGVVDIATTNGAASHKSLTQANCRTYSTTNIGARWGFMNIWTYNALRMLFYCEYASLDSQAALGRGIVDLPGGTGFGGVYCGFGDMNTAMGVNGSGVGTQEVMFFDAGATAFVAAETVTGGSSGATATIEDIILLTGAWDGSGAGYLRLSSVSGTFTNNEALTSASGAATSNSTTDAHANNAPFCWRGFENLSGNVSKFIDGYEARDSPDNYRLINRDGSGTFANPMAGGDYETSIATPITSNGYQSNIEYEDLLKYLMIPNAVLGSDSTYLCDQLWAHDAAEINILLVGGWAAGGESGVADMASHHVASQSYPGFSARIEFI